MLSLFATVCAGLFSGAALYVNLVEHPARLSCGTELAVKEFGPSYRRGTVMQASLALAGCALGVAAWARGGDATVLIAAVLLGAVVPFTLIVLLPTNKQLLDPGGRSVRVRSRTPDALGSAAWGQKRTEPRRVPPPSDASRGVAVTPERALLTSA